MNQSCADTTIPDATTLDADDARHIARLRDRHRTMLWLSLAIIAAAFLLQVRESGGVGLGLLPNISLPPLCGSRALFDVECPGCGLTRSFVALAAGDLAGSLRHHRVGWFVALAVVLQIPYRIYGLRELRTKIPDRSWTQWFGWLLIGALVGNWLLKVSGIY